jgi:hypothetical protein
MKSIPLSLPPVRQWGRTFTLKKMENQQVKTGYNYVFFSSFCGTVDFVWNDFDNKFQNSDKVDFTDLWKFECNSIPEIAKEIFQKEVKISDNKGLQIGTYDFTFDIYFNDNRNTNNMGFDESFEYCLNFIKMAGPNSYFEDYKGGSVSIYCNQTQEVVFEKKINNL